MMAKQKTICMLTGTRADLAAMRLLMDKIHNHPSLELKLVVTGMHLAPEFGETYREIEADGYPIDRKLETLLASDTDCGVTKSIGLGLIAFADYFAEVKPDFFVICGDRYEAFAAAVAAALARIPIAHIGGGDTTEGATDEFFRHSITKMSHLHFVGDALAKKRVVQMGEDPSRVFIIGFPSLETISSLKLLAQHEIMSLLDIQGEYALISYHPVTLESDSLEQAKALLSALSRFPKMQFVITKSNADSGGRAINLLLDDYAAAHGNCRICSSLGAIRYLSAMKHARMVIGNSSSGLYEAPYFGTPTVNIGNRQRGRISVKSVINCAALSDDIAQAIELANSYAFQKEIHETMKSEAQGTPSELMLDILTRFLYNTPIDLKKSFYMLDYNENHGGVL